MCEGQSRWVLVGYSISIISSVLKNQDSWCRGRKYKCNIEVEFYNSHYKLEVSVWMHEIVSLLKENIQTHKQIHINNDQQQWRNTDPLTAVTIPSRVFKMPFSMKRLLGQVAIPGLGQEMYKMNLEYIGILQRNLLSY